MKKDTGETIVRNILIILTFISIVVISFYMTNEIYTCKSHVIDINIESIRNFCNSTLFNIVLWVDNFLLYLFALIYLILGIKSKKEVTLKVSFSVFAMLTNMISIVGIIGLLENVFGIFN